MKNDEGRMMQDDDFKLLRGFADRQTDRRTNEQTFVIVESLSRLKSEKEGLCPRLGKPSQV